MPGTSSSSSRLSAFNFSVPSLPFYLKVFFLASLSKEAHAVLQEVFFGENLPSGISVTSVVSRDDAEAQLHCPSDG